MPNMTRWRMENTGRRLSYQLTYGEKSSEVPCIPVHSLGREKQRDDCKIQGIDRT